MPPDSAACDGPARVKRWNRRRPSALPSLPAPALRFWQNRPVVQDTPSGSRHRSHGIAVTASQSRHRSHGIQAETTGGVWYQSAIQRRVSLRDSGPLPGCSPSLCAGSLLRQSPSHRERQTRRWDASGMVRQQPSRVSALVGPDLVGQIGSRLSARRTDRQRERERGKE